jgi:hypothetical protein
MRVSSLSDERIIGLVSRYFVPAWLSRDRYQLGRPPREEADLVARIDADRHKKKLEGGAVCVYVVAAGGEVLATLPVQKASKPEQLAPFLRGVIAERKLAPREAADVKASAAAPPARPRPKAKDGRLFTVRTRFDGRGPNRGTSRDLVELAPAEWAVFLPPRGAKAGQAWDVPAAVAGKLLRHAYPPLPHWKAEQGKLEEATLRVKVLEVAEGGLRLRLEGRAVLIYPHQGKPTDGRVTARLVGVARCDAAATRLAALALTSEGGRYAWGWEGKPQVRAMALAVELEP